MNGSRYSGIFGAIVISVALLFLAVRVTTGICTRRRRKEAAQAAQNQQTYYVQSYGQNIPLSDYAAYENPSQTQVVRKSRKTDRTEKKGKEWNMLHRIRKEEAHAKQNKIKQ